MMFIFLALFVAVLSACQSAQSSSAELEQVQQELAAMETRFDALEQRLEAMGAGADHMEESASGSQDQVFQVTVAAYFMDTAGFHALDERINGEGVIEPGDSGTVRRVRQTLVVTDWPAGLQAKADQLIDVLDQYAEALANDDLEAAKPLAGEVHEVQHDFSSVINTWLATGVAEGGDSEHMHNNGGEHLDHTAHHGGQVGMFGDVHLEIVSEKPGEYQIFLSDANRQSLNPEGVSGTLVLNPGTGDELELPLQVMHGEHLAASGGPTDVDSIVAGIRLDDTPEGHIEMDFTIDYGGEHDHNMENSQQGEEPEHNMEHSEHDGSGG